MPITTKSSLFNISVIQETKRTRDGAQEGYSYTVSNRSFGKNRTGTGLKDYRTLIRNKQNATTNMQADSILLTKSIYGSCLNQYNLGNTVFRDTYKGLKALDGTQAYYAYHVGPADFSVAYDRALASLLKAVKSQQQHWSGPTFLGELKETIEFIRKPAASILKGLDDYSKLLNKKKRKIKEKNPMKARKILQETAANAWLTTSLGLAPLLSDVETAAETLARFMNPLSRPHTELRGFGSTERADTGTVNVVLYAALGGRQTFLNKTIDSVSLQCGYLADPNPLEQSARRLAELSGFNVREFIPTLWELVPNSWMVDYFLNIGQILSCAFTDTSRVTWIKRTDLRNSHLTVATVSVDLATPSGYTNARVIDDTLYGGGYFESHRRSVNRYSIYNLGIPNLSFNVELRDTQIANLAAVVISRFKGL